MTTIETYTTKTSATRAARKALGPEAIPGMDFTVNETKGGRYSWAERQATAKAADPGAAFDEPAPVAKTAKIAAAAPAAPTRAEGNIPDGTDGRWAHRIDAVPGVGATVEVRIKGEGQFVAAVIRAPARAEFSDFKGVGCEVAYQLTNGRKVPAQLMEYWRYLTPAEGIDKVGSTPTEDEVRVLTPDDLRPAPKVERVVGKRAAVVAAAESGTLPTPPDFTAATHARYRGKLAALVAMVEARDLKGLRAAVIPTYDSSVAALSRYRALAVTALEAQAKGSKAA